MSTSDSSTSSPNLASFAKEAIDEAQKVIDRQFGELRHELKDELEKGRQAATELALGAGMTAVGGILTSLMIVHATHRITGMPLWLSYGLIGGLLGVGGSQLMASAKSRVAEMSPMAAEVLQPEEQRPPVVERRTVTDLSR